MPLQIRRGLEAERQAMTLPLAQGELLYVTDDRKLFVGDGSTLGGVAIASYTNEDAQDAAAALFTSGQHTNISFTYNDSLARINATVNLSQYNGSITASEFRGSIVADDSTLLFNSNTGQLNLQGTIGTPVVPDTTNVYDIGSTSYKFRELYLSGANIYLGGATIAAVGATVNLPAGSTVNGVEISTGGSSVESDTAPKLGGNLDLNGKNITGTGNIGITGTISASVGLGGNLSLNGYNINGTGNISVTGTISASVGLGGDLSLNSYNINGNGNISVVGNIASSSSSVQNNLILGTTTTSGTLTVNNDSSAFAVFNGLTSALNSPPWIKSNISRGTLSQPSAVEIGDFLSGLILNAYNGTKQEGAVIISGKVDGTINAQGNIPSAFVVLTVSDTGAENELKFDKVGKLTANILSANVSIQQPVYADPAARDLAITSPAPGMMVFVTSVGKFQGYVNSTAGWVDLN